MFRRFLFLAAFLVSSTVPASAQSLLPLSFAGWNSTIVVEVQPPDLEKFVGRAAPAMREYGMELGERRTYVRGAAGLTITAYRLADATGAYGAYSYLRTPEMAEPKFTEHSSLSSSRALILIGNLVVEVSGTNLGAMRKELTALAELVAAQTEEGLYPTLGQYLPDEGRVLRSDRYVLGPVVLNELLPLAGDDWIGFSRGVEAELARYDVKGQQMTLLVAEYPTPQLATKEVAELRKRFNVNPAALEGSSNSLTQRSLFVRQSSSLVALVADARNTAAAEALLETVRYREELTWNEPSYSAVAPGLPLIIARILVATAFLCLFALIAGIAFGGLRLLVKHLWPGKVFDRDDDVEILQLGLNSKPIEAKDFY